jgi:glyoxylase-like metal-dependent hydrolase (beta-lactamase superfamily II)
LNSSDFSEDRKTDGRRAVVIAITALLLVVFASSAIFGCRPGRKKNQQKRQMAKQQQATKKAEATGTSTLPSSGFFTIEQADGAWWFVRPDGGKFISIGMNHLEPVLLASEKHKKQHMKTYGDDLLGPGGWPRKDSAAAQKWVNESVDLLSSWGFNTLGVHNPVKQNKMPYVAIFRPAKIDGWAGLKRDYRDPFDAKTETFLNNAAQEWCAENAQDPLILGISLNDMPFWTTKGKIHPWVRTVMAGGEQSPGKWRWVEFLQGRYKNAKEAAAVYGVQGNDWNEFIDKKKWGKVPDPKRASLDSAGFLPQIVDEYYRLEVAAVRSCDPNHLIFGDKFEGRDLPEWLDPIIKKHFDLTLIQWYDTAEKQTARLEQIYQNTGKPILLGDSSFSHPHPALPRAKGVKVESIDAVGDAYYHYLETVMKMPFVLGWHYCGFMEGSPELKKYHVYFSIQSGLVRADGKPYEKVVARVAEANKQAAIWHGASPAEAQSISSAPVKTKVSSKPISGSRKGLADYMPVDTDRCKTTTTPKQDGSLTRVDENIYNFLYKSKMRVPTKNISWVVTDEGVVVIDTGNHRSAAAVKREIRKVTKAPIRYIIYTHHHGTQIGGTKALKGPQTEIIAHENLVEALDLEQALINNVKRLNSIQFDVPFHKGPSQKRIYPDITYKSEYKFTLGGTRFELYHVDGESDDYTIVFLPDTKVVFVADLIGFGAPMVASPMKIVRNEVRWKKSLEFILSLEPEVLVESVRRPLCVPETFREIAEIRIAYLDFLHQAVTTEINNGSKVEEAIEKIQLPDSLASNPLVQDKYGSLEFSIRGLYHRYQGWFDKNGTHLNPAPEKQVARAFVGDMGGPKKVLARALQMGKAGQPTLAAEYLDLLIAADQLAGSAHRAKAAALAGLARQTRHGIAANMYKRLAKMEMEAAKAAPSE